MIKLFVDTSGWASLFLSTETHHTESVKIFQKAKKVPQQIVTTNYIVAELVALLATRQRASREHLFQCVDSVRLASYVDLIHVDSPTDAAAWKLCKSRPDKAWSLVDASSFVVMSQMKIKEALTTDRHFEQAGFIRLLK